MTDRLTDKVSCILNERVSSQKNGEQWDKFFSAYFQSKFHPYFI